MEIWRLLFCLSKLGKEAFNIGNVIFNVGNVAFIDGNVAKNTFPTLKASFSTIQYCKFPFPILKYKKSSFHISIGWFSIRWTIYLHIQLSISSTYILSIFLESTKKWVGSCLCTVSLYTSVLLLYLIDDKILVKKNSAAKIVDHNTFCL